MHTFGGFWVAWLLLSARRGLSASLLVLLILLIGVLWEALEFFFISPWFGWTPRVNDPIWLLDTLSDLAVDMGAGLLLWVTVSFYNKDNV